VSVFQLTPVSVPEGSEQILFILGRKLRINRLQRAALYDAAASLFRLNHLLPSDNPFPMLIDIGGIDGLKVVLMTDQ